MYVNINWKTDQTLFSCSGVDALSYDTNKIALDYHSIGFRECSSEVARYLVAVEGLDLQDPLRLRLLSHLQCYVTQLNHKTSTSWVSWGAGGGGATAASPTSYGVHGSHPSVGGYPHHGGHPHQHSMLTPPHHASTTPSNAMHPHLDQSHMSAFTAPANLPTTDLNHSLLPPPTGGLASHVSQRLPTTGAGAPHLPHVSMATAASSQSYPSSGYHLNLNSSFSGMNHQNLAVHSSSSQIPSHVSSPNVSSNLSLLNHTQATTPLSYPSLSGNHSLLPTGYPSIHPSSDSKPYRPWGTEIAYWL